MVGSGRKRGPTGATRRAFSAWACLTLGQRQASPGSPRPAPSPAGGPRGRRGELGVAQPGWSRAPPPAVLLPSSGSGPAAPGNLRAPQPMGGRRPGLLPFSWGFPPPPWHCCRDLELHRSTRSDAVWQLCPQRVELSKKALQHRALLRVAAAARAHATASTPARALPSHFRPHAGPAYGSTEITRVGGAPSPAPPLLAWLDRRPLVTRPQLGPQHPR